MFLGRITPKKGLDLLVEAFTQISTIHDDAHLVIAGPEDQGYGTKIHNLVYKHGLEHRVTFTGMLKGKEKLSAFVDADIFVLPSYSENFGLAILEAMICGLPVITTNKVNIWREIKAADAGEIIDSDATTLEQALVKMINDPALRKQYAVNGRQLVHRKYDWNIVVKQLIDAYWLILLNQDNRIELI